MQDKPKSGVPGITWSVDCKKWLAYSGSTYLGLYQQLEDAVAAKKGYDAIRPQKLCAVCGKPIPRELRRQNKYCSVECREAGQHEYQKRRYAATRPEQRTCTFCGKPIPADENPRVIFCSDECRKAKRSLNNKKYYLKRRDTPEERQKSPQDANDPTVSIVFSAPVSMRDWLQNTATKNRVSVSGYLRGLLQREMDKKGTE